MKRNYFLKGLLAAMLFAGQAFDVYAQKSVTVQLASGTRVNLPAANDQKSLDKITQQAVQGKYFWVAHTNNISKIGEAAKPGGALSIQEKIGEGTYVIMSSVAPQASQLSQWGIDAAGMLDPINKLDSRIKNGAIPAHARQGTTGVQLLVEVYKGISTSQVISLLQAAGFAAEISPINAFGVYKITCQQEAVATLAALPFIGFVQPVPAPDRTLNLNSRSFSSAASLRAPLAQGGRNLLGNGVTAGVGDDTDPTLHPDLYDRIINHSPGIVNNHGAHTTGTVGGAGIILPQRAGFAPMANIVSQWFGAIWQNAAQYVQDYNMVVTNNSYGTTVGECDIAGVYDLQSKILDEQAAQFPQLLHVFAAGNDGGITCAPFPTSYSTVLIGYQTAKNVITAGRTENASTIGGSSSSGPVKDGRLKPEIIAMGVITSTIGNFSIGNAYYGSTGTSMSAPGITGGLTLLYERYKQLKGNQNPQGALMKALLLNGARDMGNAGPDFRHGYGMMHLSNSLRMLEAQTYKQAQIVHSGIQDTIITVPAGTAQLKILLYWHDPAASVLATKALVNDLDLQVIAPDGSTVLPLVLNANPASVTQIAAPAEDHINNSEQVVINNPAAGNYTIRIRGYDVLVNAPQAYAVAFDYVPQEIKIGTPFTGEAWAAADLMPISWDYAGNGNNTFSLEYSLNNGASWTTISSSIAATERYFGWTPPAGTATSEAKLRITRNVTGETFTTQAFTIIGTPVTTLANATEQCETYTKINWTAVTGAEGYEIVMKQGASMKPIATVGSGVLTYTVSGLAKDSTYYISARAMVGGKAGWWSTATERRPNSGSCAGAISDGDLALDSITGPLSGRQFTSSALSSSTNLTIRIKNLDNSAAAAFDIKYSINGGPLAAVAVTNAIPAGATYTHTIPALNFSATGDYTIMAIVKNTAIADPAVKNDTFRTTIRHLANPAISLATPLVESFENLTIQTVEKNTTGLAGGNAWDYNKTDPFDRLRTYAQSGNGKTGSKAITMDVSKSTPKAVNPNNNLVGTFNMSSFTTSNDVRFDFWYQQHGPGQTAGTQNKVWARGSENDAWVEVYDLGLNQAVSPGVYKQSVSIELADSLAAKGQAFSASTQIRFGQRSLYAMGDRIRFGGYTFDDVRLYIAANDVQLIAIDAPGQNSCALTAATPISIRVRNSMNTPLNNIPVSYTINGGAAVNEVIPTIPANATILYTFATTANLSTITNYIVEASTNLSGDNVVENNTGTSTITNQPLITSFPYFQNFETGTNNWYANGTKSSWQFGTPASRQIKTAASGSKAWKTALAGGYNDNEKSYLYSPCFNINGLTNPMLSFSMAYDIEDCSSGGTVCDGAWVEYSYDGKNWLKLGANGSGTNWYDYGTEQLWLKSNQTHWHVASIALPKQPGSISLRFVLSTDDGVTREGLAIDDIHIFDNTLPIFPAATNSAAISQSLSGSNFVHFAQDGKVVASINPNGNNLGTTEVKAYFNVGSIRNNGEQYFANRNITIKPANAISGNPATLRYYFTDYDVNELRVATGCIDCKTPLDYTKVNVTKYSDPIIANEDGSLTNNITGSYASILNPNITFIPYDNGYYADFLVTDFSEWWITDGNFDIALPSTWVRFDAVKAANGDALLSWQTANENKVLQYEPEVSAGASNRFVSLGAVAAKNIAAASYQFTDISTAKAGSLLYRIKQTDLDGAISYSETKRLQYGVAAYRITTYPNPVRTDLLVAVTAEKSNLLQWQITDAAGRIAMQGKWPMQAPADKLRIPMQQLADGLYNLGVYDGESWQYEKIIKTK